MADYEYTNDWFQKHIPTWDALLTHGSPKTVLEIGAFEGQSTCYLIDRLGNTHSFALTCVDTWEGGVEHQKGGSDVADMSAVERRFLSNTKKAMEQCQHEVHFTVRKGDSRVELCKMIAEGLSSTQELVFVDGSHMACDVLADSVHAFQLTKIGGVIIFDDYLWKEADLSRDPLTRPKPAIDAFTNTFSHKLQILQAPLDQVFVRKLAD